MLVIKMAVPRKERLNITTYQKKYLFKKLGIEDITEIDTAILKKLKENLKSMTDTRQQSKIVYKMWDIVICVIVANFADVYDWEEIEMFVKTHYNWFKSFLQMTGGVPSYQTYENVFAIINYKELEEILVTFYKSITTPVMSTKDCINIDGRVDNGSSRKETDYSERVRPLNVLNMYSNNYGICLASEQIDEKTNEIPTVPDILKRTTIKDCIITWDALNTQTENVKAVIVNKGDYVVPIKGNQGNFYNDLVDYFNEKELECIIAGKNNSSYYSYVEKSHSSIIKYEYFQTTDIDWYFDKNKWEELHSIGLVKKTITKNGKNIIENRYYISSLFIDIIDFSNAIRNHWSVENKLHWHLDFTFKEDKNTTKNKNALLNLQIVNKFVLGILNQVKSFYTKLSLKKIRKLISFDFETNFVTLLCYLILG